MRSPPCSPRTSRPRACPGHRSTSSGDSDHGPFIDAGIPTGGLFSGGIEPKTDAEAAAFGGTAGEPADACSHRACDTIDNVNDAILEEMADAVAHAVGTLVTDD